VTPEELEQQLRLAGRPVPPPEGLRERVLAIPKDEEPNVPPQRRAARWAALGAAGLLAAAAVFGAGRELASFRSMATIELTGPSGARAEARLGAPDGANRQAQLAVRGLEPGAERYFELWDLDEQPPMLLATFMTHADGACVIRFSTPQNMNLGDLAITPRGERTRVLLCSQAHRCTGQAG